MFAAHVAYPAPNAWQECALPLVRPAEGRGSAGWNAVVYYSISLSVHTCACVRGSGARGVSRRVAHVWYVSVR